MTGNRQLATGNRQPLSSHTFAARAQIAVAIKHNDIKLNATAGQGLGRGLTGARVARAILDSAGLHDVAVERTGGLLSDHYDPRSRTLRLSGNVFDTPSVAAVGVAAHEAGHALQHAENYLPLQARSAIVPVVQFGSFLGPLVFFLGMLLNVTSLAWAGA